MAAAAAAFPSRRQRLPSLNAHLPSPTSSSSYHNMSSALFPLSPLQVTSPSCISHAFPLEVSPIHIHHQRLPPLYAFVRSSSKTFHQQQRRRDNAMPFFREFMASSQQPIGSNFTFPTLPSLKDTLHISPVLSADSPSNKSSTGVKLCGVSGCEKRAKAGGVCIAHGGGIRCSKDGCSKHAVSLGYCISHGGGKRCTAEGCQNASRKFGVCWSHGGKRMCLVQGCTKGPKTGGYCWAHGGKVAATPKK
ncbi:hypothetical protein DYB37_001690 [Aphanomyces astaci]|uniref:WRKY19-like zinc finger domain-containing protein n=1 Tax=Aphanomyces astaci TaxID=112090 RepID=A0A3R6X8F0_APHAT|nr:hypothetical protein DYB35_004715 [Aphanomyces astaci]RHZ13947.1 hypothetical protein DYB37_001690 [Aphanomyces astaci]